MWLLSLKLVGCLITALTILSERRHRQPLHRAGLLGVSEWGHQGCLRRGGPAALGNVSSRGSSGCHRWRMRNLEDKRVGDKESNYCDTKNTGYKQYVHNYLGSQSKNGVSLCKIISIVTCIRGHSNKCWSEPPIEAQDTPLLYKEEKQVWLYEVDTQYIVNNTDKNLQWKSETDHLLFMHL